MSLTKHFILPSNHQTQTFDLPKSWLIGFSCFLFIYQKIMANLEEK